MTPARPWTHLVPWPKGQASSPRVDLVADAPRREAIARFLELEGVASLSARLHLRPWLDGAEISGNVEARVTRLCGLSLEPFDVTLDEPVFLRALPPGSPHAPPPPSGEVDLPLDAEDPPEVLDADGVDLGDLVVQTLALVLDPFPRKPGADFEAPRAGLAPSPFSVLARLTEPKAE